MTVDRDRVSRPIGVRECGDAECATRCFGQVGTVTRRAEINTASPQATNGWDITLEGSTIRYQNKLTKQAPNLLLLEQRLEINSLTLPAAESEKYRAIVAELEKSDVLIVETLNKKGEFVGAKEARSGGSGWNTFWWVVRVGAVVAYFAYLALRR